MTGRERSLGGVIEELRRALRPGGRTSHGLYAVEGVRLHERALRSGTRVERAVAGEALRDDPSPRVRDLLAGLLASGCDLRFAPDEQVRTLAGDRADGAIAGLVELPRPGGLGELLDKITGSRAALVVAVDVEDPGNAGALVRTALASGAAGLVAVGVTDPYHPRAVRTSRGSLFKLPIFRYEGADPVLRVLGEARVTMLGAVSTGGEVPFGPALQGPRAALFFGSEAVGLPPALRERMDRLLTVPMAPGVDSYSVNAVAAILLYEYRRRSWIGPDPGARADRADGVATLQHAGAEPEEQEGAGAGRAEGRPRRPRPGGGA